MLKGLFLLLLCQLVGEAIAHGLGWPVPGPVLGILLLLLGLAVRARVVRTDPAAPEGSVATAADGLLKNLGLLFVPAGVGVVQSLPLIASNGVAILVALIGSTAITLAVTVGVFRVVSRLTGRDRPAQGRPQRGSAA